MTTKSRFAINVATLAAVTCGMFFGFANPSHAGGICSSAVIEEDFVLPGGTIHPAGKLTLCLERDYSPVSSLHETRVDGMPLGALISRHDTIGPLDVAESLMLFVREPGGALRLVGYTRAVRESSELYSFVPPSVTTSVGAFLPRALAGLTSPADGKSKIVVVPAT